SSPQTICIGFGSGDCGGQGLSVSLPLVSEGYVASKPPLFRSLAPHLRAVSLALGTEHALLLTADGTIYTWGRGSHGQLGHGLLSPEEEPRALEALWGVPMSSVAAGGWHSACISAGGDLYVWGWNESGQLGLPSRGLKKDLTRAATGELNASKIFQSSHGVFISIQAFPALLDIPQVSEICKVSCGSRHTAAVTGTGDLYTWGWGEYGQLGQGGTCSSDQAERVDFFSSRGLHVEDVTCGQWNTFAFARPEPSCKRIYT
uniref:RCC1 domain-containing protein 1 n=2 Tax=Denticeps clupeoides TaxID=299321 RepID=A0AAY4BKB2_9TELE